MACRAEVDLAHRAAPEATFEDVLTRALRLPLGAGRAQSGVLGDGGPGDGGDPRGGQQRQQRVEQPLERAQGLEGLGRVDLRDDAGARGPATSATPPTTGTPR